MPVGLSPYEAKRWDEIQDWKVHASRPSRVQVPEPVRRQMESASQKVSEAWHSIPGNDKIEQWIAEGINGSFHMTVDAVSLTIREDRIVRKVAGAADRRVSTFEEFCELDLRPLDRARPDRKLLRSFLAAGHGAASGFFAGGATAAGAASGGMGALPAAGAVAGLAVADAAALVSSMVQGSAMVGAHYGFDPRKPHEHAMLMSMLGAGLAREAAKTGAMMKVRDLALALAAGRTLAELSKKQLFNLLRRVSALLLLKTAKRNIAKGVPIIGAGIGAGINYASVRTVFDAAQHLYPERFLEVKYSPEDPRGDVSIFDVEAVFDDVGDDSDVGILERLEELPAGRVPQGDSGRSSRRGKSGRRR
jgi:hypothetical protein